MSLSVRECVGGGWGGCNDLNALYITNLKTTHKNDLKFNRMDKTRQREYKHSNSEMFLTKITDIQKCFVLIQLSLTLRNCAVNLDSNKNETCCWKLVHVLVPVCTRVHLIVSLCAGANVYMSTSHCQSMCQCQCVHEYISLSMQKTASGTSSTSRRTGRRS